VKHLAYMSEIPAAFQNAHSHIWKAKNTDTLSIGEQVKGWKEIHNVTIFGGCYNKDSSGNYRSINTSAIGLEFEDDAAFYIFMMGWS
jgi:hypothetical protein